MNVIHLYDGHEKVYDGRGSVPGVVWNMARETAAAGHEVTVIERQWDGLGQTATHDGVRFDRLDLPTGADEPWTRVPYEMVESPPSLLRLIGDRTAFAAAALRRLRSHEVDVLHVHLPFAASVIVTVAPWLRDRMVYTAHLGELRLNAIDDDSGAAAATPGTSGLEVPSVLERVSPDIYLARRVASTTALNPTIAGQLVASGVPEAAVRVVPNGVDVERFRTVTDADRRRVRDSYDLGSRPVVLFVGTIMPRKGVVELVEAMERVVEQVDGEPLLVLAGESDLDVAYTSRVQETIVDCGLDDHVRQVGFVPEADLPALYAVASVVAIPSFEEGFGMTAIEAMAAGTGVVGSRVGSIPQILAGDLGTVIEPGAVGPLATAVCEMLRSTPDPDRLQARADAYAWERIAEAVIESYAEITSSPDAVDAASADPADSDAETVDADYTETGATQ